MFLDAEAPRGSEAVHSQIILQEDQVARVDSVVMEIGVGEAEEGERCDVRRKGAEPASAPEAEKSEGAFSLRPEIAATD